MTGLTFRLNEEWVQRHCTKNSGPVEDMAKFVSSHNTGNVRISGQDDYSITLEVDEQVQKIEDVVQNIIEYLGERYKLTSQEMKRILRVELGDSTAVSAAAGAGKKAALLHSGSEEDADDSGENDESDTDEEDYQAADEEFLAAPVDQKAIQDVLSAAQKLRGADQFIALCNEIHRMAPILRQRKISKVLTSRSYLFSVDTGYGLNSSVNLLTALMVQEHLFNASDIAVSTTLLPKDDNIDVLSPVTDAVSQITHRFVIIDISAWIDMADSPQFRNFFLSLSAYTGDLIYVFRVPYMEQNVLAKLLEILNDVLLVQPVSFVPLGGLQLQDEAQELLSAYGFYADEGAWELFQQRIAEEKSDGRFYGILTMKKIVEDMVYQKLKCMTAEAIPDNAGKTDNAEKTDSAGKTDSAEKPGNADKTGKAENADKSEKTDEPEKLSEIWIHQNDLREFVQDPSRVLSPNEELRSLICASRIKDRIDSLLDRLESDRKQPGGEDRPMHMRFIGSPGTGKTTVARIVGRIMKERGLLDRGYFFEHSAGDLTSGENQQAAPKVLSMCRDAEGSVLFIDELSYLTDPDFKDSDTADEAIETLLGRMKNHRRDLAVIAAGDADEMQQLIRKAPDVENEMPYVLEFPDYTRDELAAIFMDMVGRSSLCAGDGLQDAVADYFKGLDNEVIKSSDFSNARFVRNLFESTWSKTVMRSQMEGTGSSVIEREDFAAASSRSVDEFCAKQMKRPRPGYHIGLV